VMWVFLTFRKDDRSSYPAGPGNCSSSLILRPKKIRTSQLEVFEIFYLPYTERLTSVLSSANYMKHTSSFSQGRREHNIPYTISQINFLVSVPGNSLWKSVFADSFFLSEEANLAVFTTYYFYWLPRILLPKWSHL
jgi:hypothetical protein